MLPITNILHDLPTALPQELFQTLVCRGDVTIERIISTGQVTPAGDWYDQGWDEWVLVLTGGAELLLEAEAEPRRLRPGDCLLIPAGCRHRVVWTDPARATVWLAVHMGKNNGVPAAAPDKELTQGC